MSDTARLFFAAWPAPEVQEALGRLALQLKPACGGRAVATRNIHITLAFLGDVARQRLASIESLAAAISSPGFRLSIDRLHYWRHNRIVWAGAAHCPAPMLELVARLEQALADGGFRVDRRPYVPHVTLLREARHAPAAEMPALAWPVTRLALVESVARDRGRAYEVLHEWPLAA